jgi:hypothetical protein
MTEHVMPLDHRVASRLSAPSVERSSSSSHVGAPRVLADHSREGSPNTPKISGPRRQLEGQALWTL